MRVIFKSKPNLQRLKIYFKVNIFGDFQFLLDNRVD